MQRVEADVSRPTVNAVVPRTPHRNALLAECGAHDEVCTTDPLHNISKSGLASGQEDRGSLVMCASSASPLSGERQPCRECRRATRQKMQHGPQAVA
jgi:hypothetical protein